MNGREKREIVVKNIVWRILERFGAQIVTLSVSIVLARILDPSVYGTVAIVTVFTTFFQVFIDSGFGNVLIQKIDADELDFSSVFYFNILLCLVTYSLLFFSSPFIARFYDNNELSILLRVSGLSLIISGLKNVQQAYISKNLLFKKFFFATIIGTVCAAIVGITMALIGFGVWAIVFENLVNVFVDTCILWIVVEWRPKRVFSFMRLKKMFSFGSKLFLTSIFSTVYNELRQLIIGKYYTASDLAFYNKGRGFPILVSSNISSAIESVLFPVFSQKQESITELKNATRRSLKVTFFVISPMMTGLAFCAVPFVTVLLKEKWLPIVFYLRFFCFYYAIDCITKIHINVTIALGKGAMLLRIDLIKKLITFLVMICTVFISLKALVWATIAVVPIVYILSAYPSKKFINYSYWEQIKDIGPIILCDLIMGASVLSVGFFKLPSFIILLIQIITGVVVYIFIAKLLGVDSFDYLYTYVKDKLCKKKANQ